MHVLIILILILLLLLFPFIPGADDGLPDVKSLLKYKLSIPLRVFSRDGQLIAEFGANRRIPVTYDEIPPLMVNAFIAVEDKNFFSHWGVDYTKLVEYLYDTANGRRHYGSSTITMQLARNLFLTRVNRYKRKRLEMVLAYKIEKKYSKKQILEIYLNKIYLGNRSYGVAGAAQIYYGKSLKDLTLAQIAMIAGLPEAPSQYNPIVNTKKALQRRNYVLKQMQSLGYINDDQYQQAANEQISAELHSKMTAVDAPHFAEMVRQQIETKYGTKKYDTKIYEDGYNVYTTLRPKLQKAATTSLRNTLLDYSRRHGYRGPLKRQSLSKLNTLSVREKKKLLEDFTSYSNLIPALVTSVSDKEAVFFSASEEVVTLEVSQFSWARKYISTERKGPKIKKATDVLQTGDIVYLTKNANKQWSLVQHPQIQGSFVSIDAKTGAITALVGGYDYYISKFNRSTQAKRQAGLALLPFIYSAALNSGYTLATIIPKKKLPNSKKLTANKTVKAITLRDSFSIAHPAYPAVITSSIGIDKVIKYLTLFGFSKATMPKNITLAAGSLQVTPLELISAYAPFANGGYKVKPFFIMRIEKYVDGRPKIIYAAKQNDICKSCPQNIQDNTPIETTAKPSVKTDNAYLVSELLVDNIDKLKSHYKKLSIRSDIRGQGGMSSGKFDAWYIGFTPELVSGIWVGFDKASQLGSKETALTTAFPGWQAFMYTVLPKKPSHTFNKPGNIVKKTIDIRTGLLFSGCKKNGTKTRNEVFRKENTPRKHPKCK